jgi:DNA (cytosine-5)-methyltransferase 1
MENKIKVASFFCGCGGSDLGILGGFKFLKEITSHYHLR